MPMRYCSIDVETTARSPDRGQVIEFACVVETDWVTPVEDLPHYHCFVLHDEIRGEPEALAMNARVIAELAKPGTERSAVSIRHEYLAAAVGAFLAKHLGPTPWTVAGKNYAGFDARFLERIPHWWARAFRHRVIDVGNLWWAPDDEALPDTAECLKRAGLTNDRPHEALEDARAVVKLVRRAYAKDRFGGVWPRLVA